MISKLINYFNQHSNFKIKSLIKDDVRFVSIMAFIFWASLILLNPGNKMMVIILFLWIGVVGLKFKNVKTALIFGFILSLPLVVGKTYSLEIIPAQDLWNKYFPAGYSESVVIKPINLISILMFMILLRDIFLRKITQLPYGSYSIILILSFICMGISSFFYSYNPDFSSFIFVQLLQIPIFFIFLTAYFSPKAHTQEIIVALLSVTAIVLFSLAALQFIQGSRTGLAVEVSQGELLDDRNFEEVAAGFRPFATFYQANGLAAFVLMIFPVLLVSYVQTRSKLTGLGLLSTILSIIASMGRSAWLSSFVGLMIILYVYEKKYHQNLLKIFLNRRWVILLFLLFFLFSGKFILPRALTTLDTLNDSGGGFVRIEQITESLEGIRRYPLFGVGLGMNVSYLYQNTRSSVVYSFPSQVHNGYFLQALETGIPSILFIMFFLVRGIINIGKDIFFSKELSKTKGLSIAYLVSIIGLLINSLFQPYLIQHREPYFELLTLLLFLGLCSTNRKQKANKNI